MEANTQKDGKTEIQGSERTHMRLGYEPCTYGMSCALGMSCFTHLRAQVMSCAPQTLCIAGQILIFPTFQWEKARFLGQLQVETLLINTELLIHYFSFRTKQLKWKANTRSFQEEFLSHLSKFFWGMFYFFCKLFLVTMGN